MAEVIGRTIAWGVVAYCVYETVKYVRALRRQPRPARTEPSLIAVLWEVILAPILALMAVVAAVAGIGAGVKIGAVFALEQWRLYRCPAILQRDLEEYAWRADPTVEKCIGDSNAATCFVSALVSGQRGTVRLEPWDCTKRHFPDGLRVASLHASEEAKFIRDAAAALGEAVPSTEEDEYVARDLGIPVERLRNAEAYFSARFSRH